MGFVAISDDTIDVRELRTVAVSVAETAAEHVRTRRIELFGRSIGHEPGRGSATDPTAVSAKSTPTDPVTVADTETEQLIRELLHRARPDDDVLGEEDGGTTSVPAGVRWVVDPIDGTVNFLYGIPAYAVSVAAQVNGRSVAGAVIDVARRITYSAALGDGACSDDGSGPQLLKATPVESLDMALVATGFGYAAQRRRAQGAIVAELLPRVRDLRRVGAAALDLCMVASGAVDAHFEHGLSPWDWAAGGLIAAEAGAVVVLPPPESRSADGHLTVAVAPGIAEEFLGTLDRIGATTPLTAN